MADYKFNPATCFKPSDLVTYLDAGDIKDDKLHHELVASLVVQGIYATAMGWKNILLYFIPKDSRQKELIESIGTTITHEDVPNFFKENIEENSEFDVIVLDQVDPNKATYRPIQLKRYGVRMDPAELTNNFIAFLDEKVMHYATNKGSLCVFLENKGTLDFAPITQHLGTLDFPFEELIVYSINQTGDAIACQLFPSNEGVACIEVERAVMFPR